MRSLSVNAQYLSIGVRKTEEVMKISKKASLLVPETLDPFLKTLAVGLVNSLNERQDVQILLHALVMFR